MKDSILQIRLELEGTQPLIWRRIQIDAACTFWGLHVAIQNAMGWTDSHLHLFQLIDEHGERHLVGLPTSDDELGVEPGWEHRVTDWLSVKRPRTVYEYDFGDGWEHAVVLEDVLPGDGGTYPRCVAGARACPPENVGGIHGYARFLEAIGDPRHEEHEGLLEWVGGTFDAERFDPRAVRFEDPKRRWREVIGQWPPLPRPSLPALPPPRMEADFTVRDQQILNNEPFSDASPLRLRTDLPSEVLAAAPLWADMHRFLQLLAAEGSWKLTARGNLQRATLVRLLQTGAVGRPWWGTDRPPRRETDLPRATLLRHVAELAGLTRKRKGRLLPTKRGLAAAQGTTAPGDLYRHLLEAHTTRYNWGCTDLLSQALTLQRSWWYLVWLLGRYGGEKRPSTFYAEKMAQAFPRLLHETMAGVALGAPQDTLTRIVEWRGIRGWAVEFGLAAMSSESGARLTEPAAVWEGPLLGQVIQWRR